MKKTNFTNSHLLGGAKAIRRLGFVAACLAITSLFGLSQANAQTAVQLGEQAVAHVQHLFEDENASLQLEFKNQPGGVNTEGNLLLANYYRTVMKEWVREGADFKDAMIENLSLISKGQGSGTTKYMTAGSVTDGKPFVEGAGNKQVRILINQVDLEDSNDQDLLDIFAYLRTLKNS